MSNVVPSYNLSKKCIIFPCLFLFFVLVHGDREEVDEETMKAVVDLFLVGISALRCLQCFDMVGWVKCSLSEQADKENT